MDKYVTGLKRKFNEAEEEGDENNGNVSSQNSKTKHRKYDPMYLSLGFTYKIINGQERPMCLLCMNTLASDSMKPSKLKRHLEKVHADHVGKTKEFFQRKLDNLNKQKESFSKALSVSQKALLASYKVSYRIAKCKKPHSIGETLVLPAAIDIIATMFGESYADQIKSIPLADNTVGRRISDISDDLCDQLIEKIKLSSFALQVDEATDVAKDAHLITYIRYVMENDIREELLFCKAIEGKATASEIFNMIDNFFIENGILWENCVGLCTDGAPSMAGKNAGLQALVRKVAPRAVWTHCMIHRQSLVARNMGEELLEVFEIIIKVVNFIKNSPLRERLFGKLCDDMGSEYKALLYYCEARWLSRAKVLQRVFELKKEIAIFLADNKKDEADIFYDTKFLAKFAYLVDIFKRLSDLNKSMQGTQIHAFVQKDKITAFMKKIELWIASMKSNNFDMFPSFKTTCVNDDEIEAKQEMIIDLSSDSTLKQMFQDEKNIVKFWLQVKDDFPTLTNKALEILLPFVTSYLCETGFSAVAVLKTKYRSRLVIEKELRTAISTMEPRFEKICAEKQAQPSH
ncbi:zinc finger BED domain-containing protein 5-like [Ctenocephalides felis]|uniref:zinc finger BED domain-containing protein 5-like n=1 Tax=Ctenocephalides felis TaxID=7515 RepID=UPI000E6E22D7|nr:zinc finger BED domain-containing protein 5-like [Ctenocephalides felis]